MLKAFKYRIYPTSKQIELINKHIGSVRFVYNLALETKRCAYTSGINLTRYDLQVQLKDLKTECEWLREINSQSLQVALMNLDAAYLRFFKGQNKFPVFKKKESRGAFSIPQNVVINERSLFIPKFKDGIRISLHRPLKGKIRQATISRTPTNKYFVSVLCETGDNNKIKKSIDPIETVGVDLGIKSFLVTSNGLKCPNPKYLKRSLSRLKFLQRKYSKRKGGRTKKSLSLLYEKISNQRRDFLQKVSAELIRDNQSIALENLPIKNLLKNKYMAQAITDTSWAMFVKMLEYKAEWNGVNVLKIGTFEPSSKTCSCCGFLKRDLSLEDRRWECPACSSVLDRDVNAAINIKNFALKNFVSGTDTKTRNELPTLVGVMTSEAR